MECVILEIFFFSRLFCNVIDNIIICGIYVVYGFRFYRQIKCVIGRYIFQVVFRQSSSENIALFCGLILIDSMWIKLACVNVYGVFEGLKDKNKNMDVQFDVIVVIGGVFFSVLVIYIVKVEVIDKDKSFMCQFVGDLYIIIFDRR